MTWRHSSPRHSSTPSSAAEGGPAATGGSRDSGTVNGSRPDDRRSPGRGPLMPRPRDRPPEPALRTAPAHRALCEPSAPPCGPVSLSRPRPGRSVSGPPATTSGARLSGGLIPSVTLAPPAHVSRGSCADPGKTPRKSAPSAGNVGAPRSQCPRAAVPPGGGAPGRRCPRAAVPPGGGAPGGGASDGGRPLGGGQPRTAPTPTRPPPAGPSRGYGPPGWDGLCVNCRNQCGPDWHIFGRSPPD